MKITMQLIYDNMPTWWERKSFGTFADCELDFPQMAEEKNFLKENKIFICNAKDISEKARLSEKSLLVCCEEGEEEYRKFGSSFPVIYIKNQCLATVFNKVTEIYLKFLKWERRLDEIADSDCELEKMLEASSTVFGNPLTLADRNMRYSYGTPERNVEFLPPLYAEEIINRIETEGYNLAPHIYEYEGYRVSSIDLFYAESHIGQLSVIEKNVVFKPSDSELLYFLAKKLEKAYSKRRIVLEEETNSLKFALKELLDGRRAEVPQWLQNENELYCFGIFELNEVQRATAGFICDSMEKRFHQCITLKYGDDIVGIITALPAAQSRNEFFKEFEAYCKEEKLFVGISRSFCKIGEIKRHFEQCRAAVKTLSTAAVNGGICFFDDCVLKYMLEHACGDFTPTELAGEGLLRVLSTRKEAVDYWNVLTTYIKTGCNASEAARLLYLHRSTFLKRLDKIKRISGMDFESHTQRLKVTILAELLDNRGTKNEK